MEEGRLHMESESCVQIHLVVAMKIENTTHIHCGGEGQRAPDEIVCEEPL